MSGSAEEQPATKSRARRGVHHAKRKRLLARAVPATARAFCFHASPLCSGRKTFHPLTLPMPSAKSIKCKKQQEFLREDLGARCARCSRSEELEFDCIIPQGSFHHGQSLCDRTNFYVQQHLKGNLQLLCRDCHSIKSTKDKFNLQQAVKEAEAFRHDPGTKPVTNRGPEPSVTDWKAWCRWHHGEPPPKS